MMKQVKMPLLALVAALTIALGASAFRGVSQSAESKTVDLYWELKTPTSDPRSANSYQLYGEEGPTCEGDQAICVIKAPEAATPGMPNIAAVSQLQQDLDNFFANSTPSHLSGAVEYQD